MSGFDNIAELGFLENGNYDVVTIKNGMKYNSDTDTFDEKDVEDIQTIESIFNQIASSKIKRFNLLPDDKLLVVIRTKKYKNFAIAISDFSKFKSKKYFKCIIDKFEDYKLWKKVQNFKKFIKSKEFKVALAGGLIAVSTAITINVVHADNDIGVQEIIEETDSIENDDFNEIVIEVPVEEQLQQNDTPVIQEFNSPNNTVTQNNFEENNYIQNNIEQNIEQNIESSIDFGSLKDFDNYDEYIRFAADLFYVSYDEAKNVVEANFNTFNNSSDIELSRMRALKEQGIIEGDLNVIGIFVTIKNYAIDTYNLDEQAAIKTSKTPEQREIDLINVAQNIYGINDIELLNCIIAVHRLETGHGEKPIATEKNNLGGNMNPNYTDETVLNIYKTTEIGAESMIRNFLNIYYKCLFEKNRNHLDPTPVFLSEGYCTHTPEAWAIEVTNLLEEGKIQPAVDKYLGNTKTY